MKGRLFRSAALTLGAVIASGAFAAAVQAAPRLVAGGGSVDWGVKESFVSYIKNPGAGGPGAIALSGPATENDDSTFNFPVRQGVADPATGELVAQLAGGVRFEKHEGKLDIRLSRLEVRLVPEHPEESGLYGHLASRQFMGPTGPLGDLIDYGWIRIVALDTTATAPDLPEGWIQWASVPSALTDEAQPAFGPQYAEDREFAPATVLGKLSGSLDPRITARSRANVRQRKAAVARVRCGLGPCTVDAPRRAKLRIGRKTFAVKVKAPRRLGPGAAKQLKVKLSRRVTGKLAGRTGQVRLEVVVDGPDERTASTTVRTKLVGGKR